MIKQRYVIAAFALMFVFAPRPFNTNAADPTDPNMKGHQYVASLISPRPGEVLVPGKVFRIEWRSILPDLDISNCETELRLSLDGGRTWTWITGERDATTKYFDWTVPNTPSDHAVLDIHFGCLGYYPETASIQRQNTFTISNINTN
jgi:hypothetical protein